MAAEPPHARFWVLGPLEVETGGRVLDLSWPRLRVLVALLLANAGRVVGVTTLVDSLWGPGAPPDARRTVQTYVSRLRHVLRPGSGDPPTPDPIVTRAPGYLLRVEPDTLDALGFERAAADGRRLLAEGRHGPAARRLAAALALWRGDAYREFDQIVRLRTEGARLDRLRLSVVEDRIGADLAIGLGGTLVGELEDLTGRHPGHERLWGHLMRALYRAGRQTDALAAFRLARAALIDEAGVEPSPALTEIHQQILAHDPALLPAGVVVAGHPPVARPAQLPPAAPGFAGRGAELAALDALSAEPNGPVIAVVSGLPGVGKTTLALHWAHRVADGFPDGQLYLNLRGFDPHLPPRSADEAIRVFLDAFALPPERIPASPEARASLYRSLLATRRMLIVLDNAATPEQVRPLLGSPGCVTLITSRDRLTGLLTADGAHPMALDRITADAARDLLATRIGAHRLADEPAAVDAIVSRCAGLPLALAIVAARVVAHPRFPLAMIAAELQADAERLDALDTGDPATRIRALFAGSYRRLEPAAARLFRLLGLHPGPHVTPAAAASLAALPIGRARTLLADLTRAHLLDEDLPGQYGPHDLLRIYAEELARQHDGADERRAATERMLEHYWHTAHAAVTLFDPVPDLPRLAAPPDSVVPERFADLAAALAWLGREHGTLAAVICRAYDTGLDTYAVRLASTVASFFAMHNYGHAQSIAQAAALGAARRLGSRSLEADALRMVGVARFHAAHFDQALEHYRRALALLGTSDDVASRAYTHHSMGLALFERGNYREALDHAERALRLFRTVDHPRQVLELAVVGACHAMLGDNRRALACGTESLARHETTPDPYGAAAAWWCLGQAHHNLARPREAIAAYERAAALLREYGNRHFLATTYLRLGDAYRDVDEPDNARDSWEKALLMSGEFGHPGAAEIHGRLDRLRMTPV